MKALHAKFGTIVLLLAVAGAAFWYVMANQDAEPVPSQDTQAVRNPPPTGATKTPPPALEGEGGQFSPPISRALERVTKKPFGLKVSPQHSPVSPEKFSGYHSGVDFETFPDEADTDVPVMAVCSGPVVVKRSAQGYGGVVAQRCNLEGEPIIVIYGHVRLSSVTARVGQEVEAGTRFAVLGTGYTSETGDERKHLHLGIHEGDAVVLLGYVPSQNQLVDWIDITKHLE